MYKINLVYTQHKASGNCNSFELYNIIERIKPDVIFEELSAAQVIESYEQKKLPTLETDLIKAYLQNHNIQHIPVDTYPLTI